MKEKENLSLLAIRIEDRQIGKAEVVGKGNKSKGIRIMIDAYKLPVKSETPLDTKIEVNK